MNLSPELVADVLVRQGVLSQRQVEDLRKEAQLLPRHLRNPRAFEQRAVAYELVQRMKFPSQNDPTGVIGEIEVAKAIAAEAGLDYVRLDPTGLNADLMESGMSRPFARRHRMIPLELNNGRHRVAMPVRVGGKGGDDSDDDL